MGDLFNVLDGGFRSEKAINKSDRKFFVYFREFKFCAGGAVDVVLFF